GLSISAQFGVRDNNEASWTQVLDNLEFMSDATHIPILLDGDTGYGNFNNMQRLIRKLEQRHIAAVCIEDKLFPKTNSFLKGEAQPLADMEEFCGKIKAGKDAQSDPDFCIIARVEAFICGWGLTEALRRAEAYHQAGADGILIHSALAVPDEILAFKREWGDRCPVVIVPTKYYATPTDVFRQHGFSLVIWANHMLRTAVAAMQTTARTLKEQENLLSIEDNIIPVSEVFRLQGAAELLEAEKRYLPKSAERAAAIVLAASRGDELGELTEDKPKTMVHIQGMPILSHIADAFNTVGIKDITVVRGYHKEAVNLPNLRYVDNDYFAETGELHSLAKALEAKSASSQDTIISYGDVLFNTYIPEALLQTKDDFVIFVDSHWQEKTSYTRLGGFAECTAPNSRKAFNAHIFLKGL
ncbi:MAG: phosphoenolpyruvate mutase, partial [Nitrospira sp.]|nr:phosphoenolpyruvate mutase [Nitrospira sp.]